MGKGGKLGQLLEHNQYNMFKERWLHYCKYMPCPLDILCALASREIINMTILK